MVHSQPLTTVQKRLLLGVALAILLLFNLPWFPGQALAKDVDSAWIMTLHHAFAEGWRFGRDIVWHYGPLGFIYAKNYHPETYGWMLFLHAVFTLCFFAGMASLWKRAPANPAVPIGAALLICATDNVIFFSFGLMLLLHAAWDARGLRSPVFWILLAACALASWVKFTYLVTGALAVIGVEALRVADGKRPGLAALAFAVLLLGFWMLAGQHLFDLGAYLTGAWELSRGFDAMAGLYRSPLYPIFFAAAGLAWIASASQAREKGKIILFLALAAQLVLVAKAGFIHDNEHHVVQALAWLFLLAFMTKELFWARAAWWQHTAIALFAAAGAALIVSDNLPGGKGFLDGFSLPPAAAISAGAAQRKTPEEIYEARQKQMRKEYALPVSSRADIYNSYADILLAHRPDLYHPRPIFQSYHAYSAKLARMNRDYLGSGSAPDQVFFSLDTMMNRYPSLDDGLSWPLLLTRYDIASVANGYLSLQKTASPRAAAFTPLGRVEGKLNQEIELPDAQGKLLWAKLHVRETWQDKLMGLLLYRPPLNMHFTLSSGYGRESRITPESMEEGFLLSPLVDNTLHFAMLATGAQKELAQKNKVARIAISCAALCFKNSFEMEFFALDLPPQPGAIAGWEKVAPYAALTMGMPAGPEPAMASYATGRHIDFQQRANVAVASMHGAGALRLPVAADGKLRLKLGSFTAFADARGKPGPVDVSVVMREEGGGEKILWQATLPALDKAVVSPPLSVSLAVSTTYADALTLHIRPQRGDRDHWVYISLEGY